MLIANSSSKLIKVFKLLEGLKSCKDLPKNNAKAFCLMKENKDDFEKEKNNNKSTKHIPVNICLFIERLSHHHLWCHP